MPKDKTNDNKNSFYKSLVGHSDLIELLESEDKVIVPDNWLVVVTDIVDSTGSIERGLYKEVNAVKAAIISSILNLEKDNHKLIPFSFGGDGASLIIPHNIKKVVIDHLAQVKLLAKSLGLSIRCGIVPVKDLYKAGKNIRVGKYIINNRYHQAIFFGEGMEYAEKLIKTTNKYEVLTEKVMVKHKLNTRGFSCRWEPIKSSRGLTLAVIIKAKNDLKQYKKILKKVDKVFGDDLERHPLNMSDMNLSLSFNNFDIESKVRAQSIEGRFYILLLGIIENLLGRIRPNREIKNNMKNKKQGNFINSDHLKYDGSLKMILSASESQINEFRDYLEKQYQKDRLYYGLYTSPAALITCLVSPDKDYEVHFVDGSEGGYALAAKNLKQQIKLKTAE